MKKYFLAAIPWMILYFLFDYTHTWEINLALRDFWRVAYLYIIFSLAITPLLKLGMSQKLLPYRRVMWILSFYMALVHAGIYFYLEYVYSHTFFVSEHFMEMDIITGVIAMIIMIFLWITSNNYSVNLLKEFWKKLQSLAYPLFVIVAIHVAFASRFEEFYIVTISTLVLLRTVAYLKSGSWAMVTWWKLRYLCVPCWFIYDPELGDPDSWIVAWTQFEDIPDSWRCPICWVSKAQFMKIWWDANILSQETFEFRVVEKKMLTKDVMELSIFSNMSFFIKPWQFGKFIWTDDEGEFIRSYSVVSYVDWIVKFCIKVSENWRWWKLLRKLKTDDKVLLGWFYWEFVLQDTPNDKVFLVTWTGISPIVYMLSYAKSSKNTLHFWVRGLDDVFYERELSVIPGLDLNIYCSDLKEDSGKYRKWRISILHSDFSKDTEFYICWNPAMSEALISTLQEKWYTRVYFEKY
ncbi:MAG: ferric-chelate reductase / rubredoxin [uncultured bacterium (gcode 4)]|uniref:Ferric-chelate reductase / rubredoxin n=1 Tax=uncultured bacterium (gcode 4) TaxID=1234023 RepID=K2G4I9_9BACT|nr:MAG: ferric-chelate reductase / rubredoxin [uncultured bacterium (gcode 4)]